MEFKIRPYGHSSCSIILLVFGSILVLVSLFPIVSSYPGCSNIQCDNPPGNAVCVVIPVSDTSIRRPTGARAECCPLWKCSYSNGPTGDFFTFNGPQGGSETVQYSKDRSLVTSTSTGSHDGVANAGGSPLEIAAVMAEMRATLGGLGLG